MDGTSAQVRVSPLVKALVLLHMFLILTWCLPNPVPAVANGSIPPTLANVVAHPGDFLLKANNDFKAKSPFKHYLLWTGTWQYWDMFSPNPSNLDLWYDTIVTYRSGRREVVDYPRMKKLSTWDKYFKERYRKYLERVNDDATDTWKRPAFAQRMALLAYKDPNDPPVKVEIRRHWRTMAGMDKPLPEGYNEYTLPPIFVDQDKLRRDAGF